MTAIHPAFTRDGEIDEAGIRAPHIDHNIDAAAVTMPLTYGDALHSLLTDREVGDVLQGRHLADPWPAMVVAADRRGGHPRRSRSPA